MNVYFISGLAADSRIFKHIQLPAGHQAVYLEWIPPQKNESLEAYSIRLGEQIVPNEPFMIVGVSMGGMVANEIARVYRATSVVIISSIPSADQLPDFLRFAGRLHIHKFLPPSVFKSASVMKRFFSGETPEDKKILIQVIRDSDPEIIRWSINAILNWKNNTAPNNVVHIHGTKDELFPIGRLNPTHIIEGGRHMMILGKSQEINQIINNLLLLMFIYLHILN